MQQKFSGNYGWRLEGFTRSHVLPPSPREVIERVLVDEGCHIESAKEICANMISALAAEGYSFPMFEDKRFGLRSTASGEK